MAAFRPESEIREWIGEHGLKSYTQATITDEAAFFEELRRIRTRGYAVDRGEYEANVRCIAAPIRDRSGKVIAAISVSAPDSRVPSQLLDSPMAAQVVKAAIRVSQALGYSAQPVESSPAAPHGLQDGTGKERVYRRKGEPS